MRGFINSVLLIMLAVAVSIFLGLSFFKPKIVYKPSPLPTPTSTSKPVVTGPIKVKGTIGCLPTKKTSGPQPLLCAIGFQTSDGTYYALNFLNQQDQLSAGSASTIEVTGTLSPPSANGPFISGGTINVTLVTVIQKSTN